MRLHEDIRHSLEDLHAELKVSEYHNMQAAESEVVTMKERIRLRGCKEEFIADPALLQEGKVLLPSKSFSACAEWAQDMIEPRYPFLACTAAQSPYLPCASPPQAQAALRGSCQGIAARIYIFNDVGDSVEKPVLQCRWTFCQQQPCQKRTWRGSARWRQSWPSAHAGWTLSMTASLLRCVCEALSGLLL